MSSYLENTEPPMTSNEVFERQYSASFKSKYGPLRSEENDHELLYTNPLPHPYSVTERVDCTKHPICTIDPPGCEDADDGWRTFVENGNLYLDLHNSDPTEWITPHSNLWNDIVARVVTAYPSNRPPIHMMPHEIMNRASLMDNEYGNIKNAITIRTQIDQTTYKPIGAVKLLFTTIRVASTHKYSYQQAAKMIESDNMIATGLKISKALTQLRAKTTLGVKLNEVTNSYPVFTGENSEPMLYQSTPEETSMKQMVAEFAIFANSFVGEYLKIHLHGLGIFRTCNASEWLQTLKKDIGGQEMLNKIIIEGIQADYLSKNASHDLVGMPEYCHFTSPLRRLADCVCHYLLKHIHLQNTIPFSNKQLDDYATNCFTFTKKIKNVQFDDLKFRFIQTINNMLNTTGNPVNISYFISSYTGLFLNLIICRIDYHKVQISYTLRIKKYNYTGSKNTYSLPITRVCCPGKFDQGSIPELDYAILKHYSL